MGLLDLQTNLKNYKFGEPPAGDRPGGGNSGQPYIKNPIDNSIIPQSEDFLFRGGLNAPLDAGVDVARLTKFFGDLKSPSGVLFVAKQNTLSRIGVQTQASPTALNEGAYTPLSTLAQAGIGFTGAHVYKQGVNPINGVNTYTDVKGKVIGENNGDGNRLVDLLNGKVDNLSNGPIRQYSGGPNSNLGIGNTTINFATNNQGAPERTGINNDKLLSTGFFNTPTLEGISSTLGSFGITSNSDLPLQVDFGFNVFKRSSSPNKELKKDKILFKNVNTVLNQYKKLLGGTRNLLDSGFNYNTDPSTTDSNSNPFLPNAPTVYPDITNPIEQKGDNAIYNNGSVTMNQEQLNNQPTPKENKPNPGSQIQDFRKPLLEGDKKDNAKKIMGFAPNYSADKQKMEGKVGSRVGLASPGQRGNRSNYDSGKQGIEGYKGVDLINASKIYTGEVRGKEYNDFVKFRIAALNRDGSKTYMHFRAFINSFNDNYGANWDSISYMGRGEEFFKYSKFTREIQVGFTVAAQSREELIPQYKKLNYLASTLAPDYGESGYMGGVITTLTLGGWFYELPGFIKSLSLTPPQESPWEIAIGSGEIAQPGDGDSKVKELPHIIDVEMSYQPIHNFVPKYQNKRENGPSRFIALKAGSTNYKS